MVTVIRMGMIMHAAKPVVGEVCSNDKYYGGYQQPGFIMGKKELQYKE
jgi:hypothetical protein